MYTSKINYRKFYKLSRKYKNVVLRILRDKKRKELNNGNQQF